MVDDPNNTQRVVDVTGNTVAYVNPNIIDSLGFSFNIFGNNISELSNALNENFIKITQNFYSGDAPINPLIGQNWFNKNDSLTYKWVGSNWIQQNLDTTYDAFMFVKYNVADITEFVMDEFVFNFTMKNIVLYNQNLVAVKFIIDPFDSRKIILKDSNVDTLYIMVFHPNDRISNPIINKKIDFFTISGQTQFDLNSFLVGNNINTLSVSLNNTMLRNNEFTINNGILSINGSIYRVRRNDKLSVWMYGGSLGGYYTNFKIHTSDKSSFLKIPKFFKSIISMEIIDNDNKVSVNPIETVEYTDYVHFEFLSKKNLSVNLRVQII